MTVREDGGGLTMINVGAWSFRWKSGRPMRKDDCLRISSYFEKLAEQCPSVKMHCGDLGMPTPGIMQEGDL